MDGSCLTVPFPDLQTIMPELSEVEDERYPVPVVLGARSPLPQITGQTFAKITAGEYRECFTRVLIIDARFPYEFRAGHVIGASNLTLKKQLVAFYERNRDIGHDTCLIFYCEFSVNRGPTWSGLFRQLDRHRNFADRKFYNLCFPFVFILEGGYSKLFRHFPHLTTGGYRRMEEIDDTELAMAHRCHVLFAQETRME